MSQDIVHLAQMILGDDEFYNQVLSTECREAAYEVATYALNAKTTIDIAVELLKQCYDAGHREGWEDGKTNAEVFAAVNHFLTGQLGFEWINRSKDVQS